MNLSRQQLKTISYFVIGLLLMVLIFSTIIPERERTVVNFIGICGSYVSVFGLIVAYIQISSVKAITELTNARVQETRDRISSLFAITHISKGIKLVDEVQYYLKSKSIESAHLRLKDLKIIILECEEITSLNELTKTSKHLTLKSTLFDDIQTLSSYDRKNGKNINFQLINLNMENISTVLIEFENKLKNQKT